MEMKYAGAVVVIILGIIIFMNMQPKSGPEFENEIGQKILFYTNQERVNAGLKPVVWNEDLKEIAQDHTNDMIANNFFEHINLQGEDPTDRAHRHDFTKTKRISSGAISLGISENLGKIATGRSEEYGMVNNDPDSIAKTMVMMWMKSPTHKEVLLKDYLTDLGVGVGFDGRFYVITQNFW